MWVPLESDPEVFNRFLSQGNVPGVSFSEIYGLDPDLLAMVPDPCLAVVMCFPLSEAYENRRAMEEKGNSESNLHVNNKDGVFFLTQKVGNACGTIALLHAVSNLYHTHDISLSSGFFHQFVTSNEGKNADEVGRAFEESSTFAVTHAELATHGQSALPEDMSKVELHFITFVNFHGTIYELDGRRSAPRSHGATTSFLHDLTPLIQTFMQEANSQSFSLMALSLSYE
jgi:ubiquitin carboxyl-terminal hydrolase L3